METNKNDLRRRVKSLLKSMKLEQSEKSSQRLADRLADLLRTPRFSSLKYLGGFAPMSTEPNWLLCLKEIPTFETAFPGFAAGLMVFQMSRFDELETRSDFGVALSLPVTNAPVVVPDVLLVPGLAFSKTGERLGRGGGYYDRYLESYQGIKIGLCYENQIQPVIPVDVHDQKMDWVVTDESLYSV